MIADLLKKIVAANRMQKMEMVRLVQNFKYCKNCCIPYSLLKCCVP